MERPGLFEIESWGNGLIVQITRLSDGASVLLQGDDAIRVGDELDKTDERFTDDDVVSQYFA